MVDVERGYGLMIPPAIVTGWMSRQEPRPSVDIAPGYHGLDVPLGLALWLMSPQRADFELDVPWASPLVDVTLRGGRQA